MSKRPKAQFARVLLAAVVIIGIACGSGCSPKPADDTAGAPGGGNAGKASDAGKGEAAGAAVPRSPTQDTRGKDFKSPPR